MEEKEKIRKDPYNYICDYVESIYPKVGRKTFEVLSLMPPSLIIPDLPFGNKKIRSNINVLFLASSGAGKTSISKLFANLTYSPLEFESVTSARLESSIAQTPMFSLIVGDFARMSRDPILLKVIEGILGEEKSISRKTMRKDIEMETEGIGLLCGVSTDLSHYITTGLVFRVIPILVGHNYKEHSEIGAHIKNKIGTFIEDSTETIIKEYYMELANLQSQEETKIEGYGIKKAYRDSLFEEWERLTKNMVKDIGLNFFRELQEGFRILCSSAFLNIYNREVKDKILYPNDEDFKIALNLMKRGTEFKFRLLRSESFAKGIKNAKDFKQLMQSDKIPEHYKEILRNLVEIKGNRVIKR